MPDVMIDSKLVILINGKAYHVTRLGSEVPEVKLVWKLRRGQGRKHYTIHYHAKHGPQCTCPDYEWRKARWGDKCKHIIALENVGLMPGRAYEDHQQENAG